MSLDRARHEPSLPTSELWNTKDLKSSSARSWTRDIYSASAKVTRTLSHQPQAEPTSAHELLP